MTRLRDIKLPLDMSNIGNEVTPIREKWSKFFANREVGATNSWDYVEMLHMWELVLKWKSPKVKELTPIALEVVAEIEEALESIKRSE